MTTFSTEIITTVGTLFVSIVIYLITAFIQQRTKKNSTLRLIGTVYAPVRYLIELRYIDTVINMLFLSILFSAILSEFLYFLLGNNSSYIIKIIINVILIVAILLYLVLRNFLIKRSEKLKKIIYESSAHITLDTDIDSLFPRWKAIHWGTLVLAEKYFLLIFIAVVSITSALFFLNKGFIILGVILIVVYIMSFFLTLGFVMFVHFTHLRLNNKRLKIYFFGSNNKRLKIYFFDTNDEIESRLFNIIKDPGICLCIVDDKGNKYCGALESITHSVVIRDMDGILVSIPYDHVYRVEVCKVKDDNTESILQPYL